jgi:chaperone LolA
LQAQFKQYELIEDGRKVDENSGSVWMQSPDLFRWHYKTPYEQLIVADGEQVWVYDEDLQQVTVKSQENNLSMQQFQRYKLLRNLKISSCLPIVTQNRVRKSGYCLAQALVWP